MNNSQSDFLPDPVAPIGAVASANGDKAPWERERAEHFPVSRGQVRESLAIPEAMQLTQRRAKSGSYLTVDAAGLSSMALLARAGVQLTPEQIFEAVELRKIQESKAPELAARRAPEENLDRLYRRDSMVAQALTNAGLGRAQSCWTDVLGTRNEWNAGVPATPPVPV